MKDLRISSSDVLEFKNSEKMLYASNGRDKKFFITLYGNYEVYLNEKLAYEGDNLNMAVDVFNEGLSGD